MTDLNGLLERCREATEASRELDLALMGLWSDVAARLTLDVADAAPAWVTPTYTGSVDAALALMGRMLPGWDALLTTGRVSCLIAPDGIFHAGVSGTAATLPLAILVALLSALISKADR